MFCPRCDQPVPESAAFCPSCGVALAGLPPPHAAAPATPATAAWGAAATPAAAVAAPPGGLAAPIVASAATVPAGFWLRVGGALIDTVIFAVMGGVCGFMVGAGAALVSGGSADPDSVAGATGFAVGLLSIPGIWLYFAWFESSPLMATPGKLALGLSVTDLDGRPIGFWRASARYFAKILSNLTLGAGYLLAAFTARKQALHDLVAGTLVQRRGG
jgi:uncharacterized RDD family membrane protein YckC